MLSVTESPRTGAQNRGATSRAAPSLGVELSGGGVLDHVVRGAARANGSRSRCGRRCHGRTWVGRGRRSRQDLDDPESEHSVIDLEAVRERLEEAGGTGGLGQGGLGLRQVVFLV